MVEPEVVPRLVERVHGHRRTGRRRAEETDAWEVLTTRRAIGGSLLAEHVGEARRVLRAGTAQRAGAGLWTYDPAATLRILRADPAAPDPCYKAWSGACVEMVDRACALLAEIAEVRGGNSRSVPGLRRIPVTAGNDLPGRIFSQARAGANAGKTTKSNVHPCTSEAWRAVAEEHGLRGVAAYPVFAGGPWLGGLATGEYGDWRQDFIATLIYGFYLEYNLDELIIRGVSGILRDMHTYWDVPGLPVDLQVRRAHMECSMVFFDAKRRQESALRNMTTDGESVWVFADRDRWRDFKAMDSGVLGHYLSFAPGETGRDDLMLTGLVYDWVDLGTDLRNGECGQSVLTLPRGSVAGVDLLPAYERTVWMFNNWFADDGVVLPDRYAACLLVMAVSVWAMTNHRHDLWRYYALAADSSGEAGRRDLYQACRFAACYTPALEPCAPKDPRRITVPRRNLAYDVTVAGQRHTGATPLHSAVCEAVATGALPMGVVTYEYVLPMLLQERRITPDESLEHMDNGYCDHFAMSTVAAHAARFSADYGNGPLALVMEQWRRGLYYAVGVGSLIEAQPGTVAGDRVHAR